MDEESKIFSKDSAPVYSAQLSELSTLAIHGTQCLYKAKQYGRWYVLKASTDTSQQAKVRIQKEFALGVQLDHPHIVHTLDMGSDEKLGAYIRFEWIDGCTLDEFLQTNPNRVVREKLILQLLDAVGYLHQQQIVHRDLKPDNILVTRNGQNIKLIDFGLSDSDDYAVLKQPAGTLSYIAPEQLQEQQTNCRSDIYSIGKLIARIRPHAHLFIVRKCTRQRPECRYASCNQIVRAIYRGKRTRIWLPVALLLSVLMMLCVFFCYMAYFRPDPREAIIQQANELMQEQFDIICSQPVSSPMELSTRLTTFYARAAAVRDSVANTIEDEGLRYDFTNAAIITAGQLATEYYEFSTGVERE